MRFVIIFPVDRKWHAVDVLTPYGVGTLTWACATCLIYDAIPSRSVSRLAGLKLNDLQSIDVSYWQYAHL